jgi:hypothetical protein
MEMIHSYTRAQAISDGQQFDTDSLSKGLREEAGIRFPVYITAEVKDIIDEALTYGLNDLNGVLWDIFTMFKFKAKGATSSNIDFKVIIYWKGDKQKTFTFYSEIGPMDSNNRKPVITIMTELDL